jgi:hypothetical protein
MIVLCVCLKKIAMAYDAPVLRAQSAAAIF